MVDLHSDIDWRSLVIIVTGLEHDVKNLTKPHIFTTFSPTYSPYRHRVSSKEMRQLHVNTKLKHQRWEQYRMRLHQCKMPELEDGCWMDDWKPKRCAYMAPSLSFLCFFLFLPHATRMNERLNEWKLKIVTRATIQNRRLRSWSGALMLHQTRHVGP